LYDGARAVDAYRYAPWFAALWIPLAGVAREPLLAAWMALLMAVIAILMLAVVRDHGEKGIPLAFLFGGLLMETTGGANLQPLLVALLYFTLHRRSGPIWLGIVASVKKFPNINVVPLARRGEWRKVATAAGVMTFLYAPALLFEIPIAAFDPGVAYWPSATLWLVVGGSSLIVAWLLGKTRYAWIAAGAASVTCIPRLLSLDVPMLLPAAAPKRSSENVNRHESVSLRAEK
jgi:hypothetical protein